MEEKYKVFYSIGRGLSRGYRLMNRRIIEEFFDHDIGTGQLHCLLALYENEGLCQDEMCNIYHLDKSAIARSLRKLEKKGLIKRETDPGDRRRKNVYLTEEGKSFRSECMVRLSRIEKDMRSKLSQREIEEFRGIIERICRNIDCGSGSEEESSDTEMSDSYSTEVG